MYATPLFNISHHFEKPTIFSIQNWFCFWKYHSINWNWDLLRTRIVLANHAYMLFILGFVPPYFVMVNASITSLLSSIILQFVDVIRRLQLNWLRNSIFPPSWERKSTVVLLADYRLLSLQAHETHRPIFTFATVAIAYDDDGKTFSCECETLI